MENLPHDETAGHCGFERELPEDTVRYLLFIIDDQADARSTLQKLEVLRKEALNLFQDLAPDYLWQRDEFNLELKIENGTWFTYQKQAMSHADCGEFRTHLS
jgi:hypothetical protein